MRAFIVANILHIL